MAQNLSAKFSPVIDRLFTLQAKTNYMLNTDYTFDGVQTVNVYSMPTVPLTDYTVAGGYGTAAEVDDVVQALTITQNKKFNSKVDASVQTEQVIMNKAAQFLGQELAVEVIPTIDKYRLGVMSAAATTAAQVITTAPDKDIVIDQIAEMAAYLDEAKAPDNGRALYVGSSAASFIRLNTDFTRKGDMSQPIVINGLIGSIFEMPVIKVPDAYFPANTKMIMAFQPGIVAPVQLSNFRLVDGNLSGVFDGWRILGHFMYDAFVLNNKVKGFAMVQTAASP